MKTINRADVHKVSTCEFGRRRFPPYSKGGTDAVTGTFLSDFLRTKYGAFFTVANFSFIENYCSGSFP